MEILIGLVIGVSIGATGLGGGVLTTPTLILLLGLSPLESVGAALVFSSAAKLSGALVYLRRKQVDFRVLAWLLTGGIPGAVLGSLALSRLQARQPDGWVLSLLGATIALSAGFSLLRPANGSGQAVERLRLLPLFSLPVGLAVGSSSAGAGALGTLLLFGFTRLAPAAVVGTDIVFGLAVSAVGGGLHLAAGAWNGVLLLKLLAGGMVGAAVGARLVGALPGRVLRAVVLLWALLLGLLLVRKGLEGVF